ncbi:MAG TPA: hypothetical protein VIG99_29965 [Myxococcaceae bacterium]|jgi:hypothetical protein
MNTSKMWQTPTFCFQGNLASFNPKSKQHVSLMFQTANMAKKKRA